MSSASSPELQLLSSQRDGDQQVEDPPIGLRTLFNLNCFPNRRKLGHFFHELFCQFKLNFLSKFKRDHKHLERWKQLCSDKTKLFKCIMSLDECIDSVTGEEWWLPVIESFLTEHQDIERQSAFAVVRMRNGEYELFDEVIPTFVQSSKNKNSTSLPTKRAEEILISRVNTFIETDGSKVNSVCIFSINSPCLKREREHIVPCMFLILKMAAHWQSQYGISINVVFIKYWGLGGKNCFKDVAESQIVCPNSGFFRYFNNLNEDSIKLLHKKLNNFKNPEILPKKYNSVFDRLTELAKRSYVSRKDHLKQGKEKIDQFEFDSEDQDESYKILCNIWHDFVNENTMSHIQELITADSKPKCVQYFASLFLGSHGPFRLYQIPRDIWN
ncbi:uncharacterized protein LOC133986085 [Scomber scombrus]|uniref:uncharacterized protein LOC133986085 n=1 Tax=Scomber scombrus TaxID=13677 RepID=UPI002DD98BF7|nr:uncharacterized protein LOC133986085 [Scomber scombrus]XP_062281845.1 uncharacterized protein LOC133986085 [Scomber scombrus]